VLRRVLRTTNETCEASTTCGENDWFFGPFDDEAEGVMTPSMAPQDFYNSPIVKKQSTREPECFYIGEDEDEELSEAAAEDSIAARGSEVKSLRRRSDGPGPRCQRRRRRRITLMRFRSLEEKLDDLLEACAALSIRVDKCTEELARLRRVARFQLRRSARRWKGCGRRRPATSRSTGSACSVRGAAAVAVAPTSAGLVTSRSSVNIGSKTDSIPSSATTSPRHVVADPSVEAELSTSYQHLRPTPHNMALAINEMPLLDGVPYAPWPPLEGQGPPRPPRRRVKVGRQSRICGHGQGCRSGSVAATLPPDGRDGECTSPVTSQRQPPEGRGGGSVASAFEPDGQHAECASAAASLKARLEPLPRVRAKGAPKTPLGARPQASPNGLPDIWPEKTPRPSREAWADVATEGWLRCRRTTASASLSMHKEFWELDMVQTALFG